MLVCIKLLLNGLSGPSDREGQEMLGYNAAKYTEAC